MSEQPPKSDHPLTLLQETALYAICARYNVEYNPDHYHPTGILDGLPEGYYAGWVGGWQIQKTHPTLYIGVSPEGRISS